MWLDTNVAHRLEGHVYGFLEHLSLTIDGRLDDRPRGLVHGKLRVQRLVVSRVDGLVKTEYTLQYRR